MSITSPVLCGFAPVRSSCFMVGLALIAAAGCTATEAPAAGDVGGPGQREWRQLFNGTDLSGWDIKIAGYDLNENPGNTFRVEDGLLKVRYDGWSHFDGQFGHIFHRESFSYYIVAAEYRFVGEQVAGAGSSYGWARRNNGIMIHSQSARSMAREQDFPISIEVQLLGGLGDGPRSTANLCTLFVTDGACMSSSGNQNPSITYMALTARAVDHAVQEMNRLVL